MGVLKVIERIQAACARVGREPKTVQLVAVTKGHTVQEIQTQILAHGSFPLGESRVQEALPKMEVLPAQWHFIGPLQRNKARFAISFELIHSVDSVRLAETLARKAMEAAKVQPILLELNLGRELQKHGFLEEELPEALAQIRQMQGLDLQGLMTIAPYTEEPQIVRPIFAQLSRLADRYGLPSRSMGMSGDLDVAIEEGATLVRVGTACFAPDV